LFFGANRKHVYSDSLNWLKTSHQGI
jgi:hypothetical protein